MTNFSFKLFYYNIYQTFKKLPSTYQIYIYYINKLGGTNQWDKEEETKIISNWLYLSLFLWKVLIKSETKVEFKALT